MIAHDLLDLSAPRRLHLLGIGGSGMAPFARLLRAAKHTVSGADARANGNVTELREEGVAVWTGPEAGLLPAGLDGVIHSAAIHADAPPVVKARAEGLPVLKYARALGTFAAGRETIAVAGTHGKTTTSGLLAYLLQRAGADAAHLIGGCVPQLAGAPPGGGRRLVVEACEYDRSFLHLRPRIAIVTNIEADHLDYYRDIVEITAAFRSFATQVEELLVIHEDLRETLGRAGGIRARVVTFGTGPDADLRLRRTGLHGFVAGGREYQTRLPGNHNMLNAGAVLAVARELGVSREVALRALRDFDGVGRRLQVVGRPRGVPVIDDYAHHPTEVAAGLRALREEYAPRRLWVVFQPHQYSRLRRFLPDFAQALVEADRIVIPEVFAARDAAEDLEAVSAGDLVSAVRVRGGDVIQIRDFGAIVDFVSTQARAGDVVVTMGAGDVGNVAGRLARAL